MPRDSRLFRNTTTDIFRDFVLQYQDYSQPEARLARDSIFRELDAAKYPGKSIRVALSIETLDDPRRERDAALVEVIETLSGQPVTQELCQIIAGSCGWQMEIIVRSSRAKVFVLKEGGTEKMTLLEGSVVHREDAYSIAEKKFNISASRAKYLFLHR